LAHDRDRYVDEDPPVRSPDAIVVSGDIIQGVPLKTPNHEDRLKEQYQTAKDFLGQLAAIFVQGERYRVVDVQGNRDIDWNTARNAMTLVSVDDMPSDLPTALFQEGSLYRWNWKTRELYVINDPELYAHRLDAFSDFIHEFYSGVSGLLRVSGAADANLFTLCDGRIGIAAFNSCAGNDCFAYHGLIPRQAIARSDLDLTQATAAFDLRMAVWHHSIEGPPYRTDYMDIEIVRGMIGRGFRVGLYGHQHKAQAVAHQVYLPDRETMAVVSAGSLCAGSRELPPGVHRQYNVVEVADDYRRARIHVRSMGVANLFVRASLPDFAGQSYADLEWEPAKDPAGRPINPEVLRLQADVDLAERQLKEGNPGGAMRILLPRAKSLTGYPRQLLIDAAFQAGAWGEVIATTDPPRSIAELMNRFEAAMRLRDRSTARDAIDQFADRVGLPIVQADELRRRVTADESLGR